MKVKFQVRQDLTRWSCDHGQYDTADNPHTVSANKEFVSQIAAAESAGALLNVEYEGVVPVGAVQSDKDSLKAQAKAMAAGEWQVGNQMQFELQAAQAAEEGVEG